MSTKSFKELKNLSKDELTSKMRDFEYKLFQARMGNATGQLKDTASLWKIRKGIARIKMLMSQSTKSGEMTGTASGKAAR